MLINTLKERFKAFIDRLDESDERKEKERSAFSKSMVLIVIINEITQILLSVLSTNTYNYTYNKVLFICRALIIFFLILYERATQRVIYISLSTYFLISLLIILSRVI